VCPKPLDDDNIVTARSSRCVTDLLPTCDVVLVGKVGFEPTILSALVPKTSVYPVPPLAHCYFRGRHEAPALDIRFVTTGPNSLSVAGSSRLAIAPCDSTALLWLRTLVSNQSMQWLTATPMPMLGFYGIDTWWAY
jgi:hypothetical protein